MLAVISFALLAMALYNYRCLVQMWLYMSCVLIIFGVFASFLVCLLYHCLQRTLYKIFFGVELLKSKRCHNLETNQ
ncbi:unnamed protein product [Brugia timori]|uniref:Envelope protein n=1 Tax=Brugia timori TaxID=42155 RepID=A0A0R3QGD5_9BILA|nr:unnamed protein product [Brugia timori]